MTTKMTTKRNNYFMIRFTYADLTLKIVRMEVNAILVANNFDLLATVLYTLDRAIHMLQIQD